jgi:hypothetical protein
MRAIRAASAALLGIGALTLTACTSAVANDDGGSLSSFGYNLQPTTIEPGGRLTLPVRGCGENATVFSGVFDTVTVPRGRDSATTTVDWNARPGTTYDVTFQCGRRFGHRNLAIAAGHGGERDENRYGNQYGEGERERPGYERHGVHAGLGGSIGGFDLKEIGLGASLIAGTLGAAWYMSRGRAADRTS